MCKKKAWYRVAMALGTLLASGLLGLTAPARASAQEAGYELAAENDRLELYYQPESLAIRIRDKDGGYVYDSCGPEPQEGDLNATYAGMRQSGISVECRLENGNVKTLSITEDGARVNSQGMEDGFRSTIGFSDGISFEIEVTLTENGIRVLIPEASIEESPESADRLQSIFVYPFLGSSYGYDNNGYLFVPDGCGALISTGTKTVAAENYEKQIYGSDLGLGAFKSADVNGMLKPAEEIYMPVFGSILEEGKQGIAGIVTEGDEYCKILAQASGIRTPYNLIQPKFILRETYQMKLSQSGSSLTSNQEEKNPGSFGVTYVLLSGEEADYVGIAKAYRQWLLEGGKLTKQNGGDAVPVRLEMVLSEQEKGLIGSKTVTMTTLEQTREILQELCGAGLSDMNVVLRGYSGDGASGAGPSAFSFSGKTGSKSAWKKEIQALTELGIDVSLYADFTRGYEEVGGYGNKDEAQAINRTMLESFDNGAFNWLAPSYTANALNKFAKKASGMGMTILSLDAFGRTPYSNWNRKAVSTRADAVRLWKQADTAGMSLNLYAPFAYIWERCGAIYDMPSGSSNYYIFTQTVPFMQIVLKGCIPYYSEGWNFHANAKLDLLQCVEYGAYPTWYVTYEDSVELIDTASSWIYSSQYAVWKDSIIREYGEIKEGLGSVSGACMEDRVVLAEDVVRVDYDNGVSIYVNYGKTDWTGDGVTVGGESYLVNTAAAAR